MERFNFNKEQSFEEKIEKIVVHKDKNAIEFMEWFHRRELTEREKDILQELVDSGLSNVQQIAIVFFAIQFFKGEITSALLFMKNAMQYQKITDTNSFQFVKWNKYSFLFIYQQTISELEVCERLGEKHQINDKKLKEKADQLSNIEPIEFLAKFLGDTPLPNSQMMINEVLEDTKVEKAVLNVIMEYTLMVSDCKVQKNYIKTIAKDLVRRNIKTPLEAMVHLKNEHNKRRKKK